ncbi:hypothetical protein U9M48_001597 [Paspalum notatum var. saurae]|uniref:Uncharacterized protein n=1 Tax=Paspalum notatum var. saurae TaxID=547442 RepID=A0AAQ3PGL4_PASNO
MGKKGKERRLICGTCPPAAGVRATMPKDIKLAKAGRPDEWPIGDLHVRPILRRKRPGSDCGNFAMSENGHSAWGHPQFIKREKLETSYVKDDSFQIRCDVTILNEFRAQDTTIASPPAPPATDLHQHLGDLLASEVGGDMTFKVAGERITAHRYVLAARSSVFMALFFGPMEEKTTECITIEDMEPRVFKAMLRFIYMDWLPPKIYGNEEMAMAQHFLVAADRYDLLRLKLICEGMLCSSSSINTDTVATTLLLAEQHGCKALKEACFKFLKPLDRLKAVAASDGFEHLIATCPSLVMELLDNMVSGSHILRINGNSGTRGLGVGKSIKSSSFSVAGHNWCIEYYPDGLDAKNANWIHIVVGLAPPIIAGDDDDCGVKAKFRFSLHHMAALLPVSLYSKSDNRMHLFTSKNPRWGYTRFIARRQLESSTLLMKDDSFSIRCDLAVLVDIRAQAAVPPSDLHEHLGNLLGIAGQVGGDVTFEVGGEQFTAHRVVLATRSAVFMAELFGPMKEKVTTLVRVDDMEARVFRTMLHFVYTDSLPKMDDDEDMVFMAQHLLVAADRYDLARLKLICEDMLRRRIDVNVAATTLVLAEQHGVMASRRHASGSSRQSWQVMASNTSRTVAPCFLTNCSLRLSSLEQYNGVYELGRPANKTATRYLNGPL